MDFISTKEAADKWQISRRRVIRLAAEGRIPGAVLFGKSWMIPADTRKPADGRTKRAKAESAGIPFRFPFYMNSAEEGFFPPLCEEEKSLRQAQIDFLACDFEKAKAEFEALKRKSKNNGIRIAALFFLCYLSVASCSGEGFGDNYHLLNAALSEDPPHWRELELLRPYLLGCFALYKNAAETFHFDIQYEYAPSAYPVLYFLSCLTKAADGKAENMDVLLETSEINAKHLEKEGHYYEAQMMHVFLLGVYSFKANEEAMVYHLKKGLDIALEFHFIYPVADVFVYYPDLFDKVLKEYPAEFANRISRLGNRTHQSFARFMSKNKITDLYMELSKSEYQYVFYACEGYSNSSVAEMMHLSPRTVANRYAEIYDKLEVKGKQELIRKMKAVVFKENGSGENADE